MMRDDDDWNAETLFFDEELPRAVWFVRAVMIVTVIFGLVVFL